jgi:hypothetical protein
MANRSTTWPQASASCRWARDAPSFATAVVTRGDTEHVPTVAFLRAVPRARTVIASGSPVVAVA